MSLSFNWQPGRNPFSGQAWPYTEVLACVREFLAYDESLRRYDFLPGLRVAGMDNVITARDTERVAEIDVHLKRYRANRVAIQERAEEIAGFLVALPPHQALEDLSVDEDDAASMAVCDPIRPLRFPVGACLAPGMIQPAGRPCPGWRTRYVAPNCTGWPAPLSMYFWPLMRGRRRRSSRI